MLKKVMAKMHVHVSDKVLKYGSHYTDMTYLGLVFVFSNGPYTWAAGALFLIKAIGILKHEEV